MRSTTGTSMVVCTLVLVLALAASGGVRAQTAGDVLWTVDLDGFSTMSQPRVAPDGTIYIHTNTLYAISPSGQILWSTPLVDTAYIDIGADGTVYAGSGNTIYAFNPDGTLKWSFTENPAGQGLMVGPTVGPDGNIYAISDLGGLGAFSLTPSGQLRWNVPGFGNVAGTGLGRVQFGTDRLYFAEDIEPAVGGCQSLQQGLAAVTLDGHLDWCVAISGVSRPVATLAGDALTWQGALSSKTLTDRNPDSSIDWNFTFGFTPTGINSVSSGSDGNIYLWHGISTLASLTPAGTLRWEQPQAIVNFPNAPALSPDGQALVAGSGYGFGVNGEILAVNPSSGALLWKIPVTGPSAGAGAPAAFSPDGQVVYVPVNTISFGDPDQLWAIQASGGLPSVPAAPTNLLGIAQSKVIGGTLKMRIGLKWTDNANNETGFIIQRCAGSACTNFSTVLTAGANVTKIFDTTVAPATTYRYRVAAANGAILSGYSNIVTVTTP